MSIQLQQYASSHQVQLAGTALISGLLVASAIYGAQALSRKAALENLKASIPILHDDHACGGVCS